MAGATAVQGMFAVRLAERLGERVTLERWVRFVTGQRQEPDAELRAEIDRLRAPVAGS